MGKSSGLEWKTKQAKKDHWIKTQFSVFITRLRLYGHLGMRIFPSSENTFFCRDRLSSCLFKVTIYSPDVMSLFTVTKTIIEQILWLGVCSSLISCLGWSHLWLCGGTNYCWFLGGRLPFYVLVSCRWLCWVHQSVHFSFPSFVMYFVDKWKCLFFNKDPCWYKMKD